CRMVVGLGHPRRRHLLERVKLQPPEDRPPPLVQVLARAIPIAQPLLPASPADLTMAIRLIAILIVQMPAEHGRMRAVPPRHRLSEHQPPLDEPRIIDAERIAAAK